VPFPRCNCWLEVRLDWPGPPIIMHTLRGLGRGHLCLVIFVLEDMLARLDFLSVAAIVTIDYFPVEDRRGWSLFGHVHNRGWYSRGFSLFDLVLAVTPFSSVLGFSHCLLPWSMVPVTGVASIMRSSFPSCCLNYEVSFSLAYCE
jgi:hypothetical protein